MEDWELIARESIRDLVVRYNSNGDSGRFAEVLDLFAPDAVMDFSGRSYVGPDEIAAIFTGTRDRMGGPGVRYLRHFTATHQIDVSGPTTASGRVYFAAISSTGLDHWGRYLDEYRVVDGRWRFAHRRVATDGQSPSSVMPRAS